MPGRGRKPKPTSLRLLEGNPGKRPLPVREPEPLPGTPDPPGWLSEEARAEWARVTSELEELGMLSRVERSLLVAYCLNWSIMVASGKKVEEEGWTDENGKRSADAVQLQNCLAQHRYQLGEMGLTPSSRTKVKSLKPAAGESGDEKRRKQLLG